MAKKQSKEFIIKQGHESMSSLPAEVESDLLSSKNIVGPDYYIVRASSNEKTSEEINSLVTTVSSKTPTSMTARYESARLQFLSKGYTAEEFKETVKNFTETGLKDNLLIDKIVEHVSALPVKQTPESINASDYLKQITDEKNHTATKNFDKLVKDIITTQMNNHVKKYGEIEKNHQVAYVLGSAAAGKSTTIKSLRDTMNAFPADQDRLKADIAKALGIDINDPAMQKIAKLAMEKLITFLKTSGYNYIHEKVGDEPHKMLKLFKESTEAGYEMQLHCVHTENNVCRVRNQNRCIGLINDGEPARIVPDNVVQEMGNRALSTYLFVMKNYGEYFTEGHCYCSDTSTDPKIKREPQEMLSLAHGSFVNEKRLQQYVQSGIETYRATFQSVKQKLMVQFKQAQPTLSEAISQFEPDGRLFETPPLHQIQATLEVEIEKVMVQVFAPHRNYNENRPYNLQEVQKVIDAVVEQFDLKPLMESMVAENEKAKKQNQTQQTISRQRTSPDQTMESENENSTKNM